MKVALIRHEFRRHRGGGERYGQMVASGLVAAGHEVHLFASRVDETLPEGVVHHPVPAANLWSPLRRYTFDRAARRRVDLSEFDIVQALEPYTPCDVYQAGDGLHRHWLSLPEARSSWLTPQHPIKLAIERRAFRPDGRSRITVPSRLVKRQATRLYGVPPSRIDVIEPPIEGERFARIGPVDVEARERDLGIPRDAVVCCFVGMNYRRKGLPTLLAAMERLDPRYHLLIVGRDRRSWTFRWRARRGALAGRVHFLGKTDSIDAVLGHSDVLVLPSLYEPFGLVVTEAMAASRPVVASASTGASELVRDGESGFVLRDARDPDELAKRLAQLDDRDVREAMGREAARAVGGLTPERHLERILEVYERVRRERSCRDDVQGRTHEVKSVGAVQTVAELAPRLEAENVRDYEALAALPVERTLHAVRPERRTELVRLGDLRAVRKLYAGDPRGGAGEWRALLDLAAAGLAGPPPLAFASGPGGSAVLMGFVEGEEQLDHWSVDQLAKLAPPEARHLKRRVIRALADHVRAFHGRGFTHRDLYLGHVWVRESDLHLRFMDLHRVEQRTPPPRRRVVKDLAALHFSALHHVRPTRQDQLRFFKRYLGVEALSPAQRRLAKAVLRKSARIAHHHGDHPV